MPHIAMLRSVKTAWWRISDHATVFSDKRMVRIESDSDS